MFAYKAYVLDARVCDSIKSAVISFAKMYCMLRTKDSMNFTALDILYAEFTRNLF